MLLRSLRVDDEREAVLAQEKMVREDWPFLLGYAIGDDFAAYVARTDALNQGNEPWTEGGVPGWFFVAEDDGRIVGRLSLRRELNEYLRHFGGHLGYGVLPEYRGRGYAKAMLRDGLEILRSAGTDTALLTCDEDNPASRRVIESQGGRMLGLFPGERAGDPRKCHFVFGNGELEVTR
jgi:predicted acetyltransferase